MSTAAQMAAALTAGVNLLAAAGAGWAWWRWDAARWPWWLVRAGQGAAVLLAVAAGIAAAAGLRPADGLFWLYALLPVAVSFVAEQLRVLSAQAVLDARDLQDAQAVGELPEDDQREIVLAILRREIGVMAIAAVVLAFLALRALAEL